MSTKISIAGTGKLLASLSPATPPVTKKNLFVAFNVTGAVTRQPVSEFDLNLNFIKNYDGNGSEPSTPQFSSLCSDGTSLYAFDAVNFTAEQLDPATLTFKKTIQETNMQINGLHFGSTFFPNCAVVTDGTYLYFCYLDSSSTEQIDQVRISDGLFIANLQPGLSGTTITAVIDPSSGNLYVGMGGASGGLNEIKLPSFTLGASIVPTITQVIADGLGHIFASPNGGGCFRYDTPGLLNQKIAVLLAEAQSPGPMIAYDGTNLYVAYIDAASKKLRVEEFSTTPVGSALPRIASFLSAVTFSNWASACGLGDVIDGFTFYTFSSLAAGTAGLLTKFTVLTQDITTNSSAAGLGNNKAFPINSNSLILA